MAQQDHHITIQITGNVVGSPEQLAREIHRALKQGRSAGAVFVAATSPTRWQRARDLAARAALRVVGVLVVAGAAASLVREWLAWTR